MKGVSEEEFNAGDNVCKEEKCIMKGLPLETADHCEICNKLFKIEEHHTHN